MGLTSLRVSSSASSGCVALAGSALNAVEICVVFPLRQGSWGFRCRHGRLWPALSPLLDRGRLQLWQLRGLCQLAHPDGYVAPSLGPSRPLRLALADFRLQRGGTLRAGLRVKARVFWGRPTSSPSVSSPLPGLREERLLSGVWRKSALPLRRGSGGERRSREAWWSPSTVLGNRIWSPYCSDCRLWCRKGPMKTLAALIWHL